MWVCACVDKGLGGLGGVGGVGEMRGNVGMDVCEERGREGAGYVYVRLVVLNHVLSLLFGFRLFSCSFAFTCVVVE